MDPESDFDYGARERRIILPDWEVGARLLFSLIGPFECFSHFASKSRASARASNKESQARLTEPN